MTPIDLDTLTLARGAHGEGGEMCVMEAVAMLAGEPWSDHPECVSPVIAAFCRSWNDALEDPPRTQLLKPLLQDVIGTMRVHTPAWLRLAGLTEHAQALEACARIVDAVTARSAQPSLEEARRASAAACAAARDAARDAAKTKLQP